jgi:hypothetical protein
MALSRQQPGFAWSTPESAKEKELDKTKTKK